jgi:hypothetical protein
MSPGPRPRMTQHARRRSRAVCAVTAAVLLLLACANKPLPPDWQGNAFAALSGFSAAYLSGNSRLADFEFSRVKAEISRTGRPELMARAELTRCAVRAASLALDACAGYLPLAQDAAAGEQAYAEFLSGRWTPQSAALLPEHYRALALQTQATGEPRASGSALGAIDDPLARLIAAAALLQHQRLTPADIEVATDTASRQGWRRPLLAWLGLQLRQASAAGEAPAAARLQRRIDLVLQTGGAATPP